jgi:adenosylcobinamide-phosphate synthase
MEPAALTVAYMLDLLIGDPRFVPHPVRWIGRAIEKTENMVRKHIDNSGDTCRDYKRKLKREEKKAGTVLVLLIVGLTYLIFYVLNSILMNAHMPAWGLYVSFIVLAYLVSTTIATRELLKSVNKVKSAVHNGRTEEARDQLGMIVGRDTQSLDNKSILKASIETLSENASDGVVAPLFYFAIGGLPLAMAYKAVNTLDSMVGYKNSTYKNLGWASAKLDDIANYFPARITGILIVVATYIVHLFRYSVHKVSTRREVTKNRPAQYVLKLVRSRAERTEKADFEESQRAFGIMMRDGRKHASPNSGIPEAAMAGALGVQLGGPSTYGGLIMKKPYIGREFQHREQGVPDDESLYVTAVEKGISIIKIVSLLGLLTALAILYMRAVLWS